MYEIRFTGAAGKYLKKVKEKGLKKAFQSSLNEISSDPYIGELKTGDLAGTRENFYNELKRYMRVSWGFCLWKEVV